MSDSISFVGDSFRVCDGEGRRAATRKAAMRRCLPHIVSWDTLQDNGLALLHLPPGMNRDDLLSFSRREQVILTTSFRSCNIVELHFDHLEPSEVEEDITRLGRDISATSMEPTMWQVQVLCYS